MRPRFGNKPASGQHDTGPGYSLCRQFLARAWRANPGPAAAVGRPLPLAGRAASWKDKNIRPGPVRPSDRRPIPKLADWLPLRFLPDPYPRADSTSARYQGFQERPVRQGMCMQVTEPRGADPHRRRCVTAGSNHSRILRRSSTIAWSASPILVVLTQVPRKADRYEPAAFELANQISSRKLPLSGPVFLINAQKKHFQRPLRSMALTSCSMKRSALPRERGD